MIHRCWLFVAVLLMSSVAFAQSRPSPAFATFGVAEGLPSGWVYAVAQDRDGYLWFGTHDGLARYDGVETRVFRADPSDPTAIGGNDIVAVLVDRQGRIWAGGEGSGLNRLDPGASQFTRWQLGDDPSRHLAGNDVFALAEGSDGRVWVGLYGAGIAVIDHDASVRSIRHDPADPGSLRSDNVLSLRMDANDRLWIGSERGLDLRHADGRIQHLDLGLAIPDGSTPMVYAFSPEADGGMLVGTRYGVARIDGQLRAGKPVLPDAAISLLRDRAGTLWVGSRNGVLEVNGDMVIRHEPREGLPGFFPGRRVFSILQDHEDGLWFATIEGGVGRLRPHWKNFSSLRHIPGDPGSLTHAAISAIDVGNDAVWAVSADDGLDRIDLHDGHVTRHAARLGAPPGRLTAVLAVDGALWIGHRAGIRILPEGGGAPVDLPVDAARAGHLPAGPVNLLRRAPDGAVWAVALGGGVARIDPRSRNIERYDEAHGQLTSSDVRAIAIDAANQVWLASAAGIERHLPGSLGFQRVTELAQNSIDALAVAADGSLWLHHADGVENHRLVGGRFVRHHVFGVTDGLPALSAAALSVDNDGDVWMSSTRGLWRLRPQSRDVEVFGDADGLPGIEFTIGAMTAEVGGRIWAATRSGLVSFEPHALQSGLPLPLVRTVATTIRRDGAEVPLEASKPIVLGHADRELTVEVRALSFANPARHRYRFRMAGVDSDWTPDGRQGERVFSRLDPGDYQLEASANVGDGWSPLPVPLSVRVNPAPWLTGWAFAVYGISALLLVGIVVRGWRRRLQRRHELQLALQRQQAAEQLAQAKSDFLATMSHEIRTPLTGVLGMAELLNQAPLPDQQRGQVQAIRKSGELLLRLVNDIVDLARIEAGRFSFDLRPFDPASLLDECIELTRPLARRRGLDLRLEKTSLPSGLLGDALRIEQILLNLIGNALKFTERGEVSVHAGCDPSGDLIVRVRDTGPGMSPELLERLFQRFEQADDQAGRPGGSGLGLAISRELADLMGGGITVETTLGSGSCFSICLPLPHMDLPAATATVAPPVDPASLLILMVEDDPIVASVIAGLLDSLGHRHVHASDGLGALALASTQRFDVILLDLDLPGIHGLQLANLLRSRADVDIRCALLAVSASIRIDESRLCGADLDGFLSKPVSAESLSKAIMAARAHRAEQMLHVSA